MPLLIYQLIVLSFAVALLTLLAINMRVLPTLDPARKAPDAAPLVSILVPARNEAANIERCVRSLLAQNYPRFEVLVLDDQSSDETGAILTRIAAEDARLRVLNGGPLLAGWLGKANACRQLAAAAQGEYLLFTDADTFHRPAALAAALAKFIKPDISPLIAPRQPVGLLSMFPRQVMGTPSERLIIPLMHFAVYGLLPLAGAFRLRSAAFAAANGQFMLFSRAAYEAAGGHAAVKGEVLEDVALSQAVKRAGYAALLVDGGELVSTRMYRGFGELWAGFSKNLFAFFGNSLPFLIAGMAGYAVLYVLPVFWILAGILWIFAGWHADAVEILAWVWIPLAQYGLTVIARLILARRFGFDLLSTLLHPLAIAVQIAIAFNSARLFYRGGAKWKDRRVVPTAD